MNATRRRRHLLIILNIINVSAMMMSVIKMHQCVEAKIHAFFLVVERFNDVW